MALWDDVKKNMGDWYTVAAEKTNELAKVGVRRYDIFGISRDIERQFSEMGNRVYVALGEGRTDFADDLILQGLVERVRTLEAELKAKQDEIEEIRSQDHAAADEAEDATPSAEGADDEEIEVEIYETTSVDPEDEIEDAAYDEDPDSVKE
jgi:hypothetical protein